MNKSKKYIETMNVFNLVGFCLVAGGLINLLEINIINIMDSLAIIFLGIAFIVYSDNRKLRKKMEKKWKRK